MDIIFGIIIIFASIAFMIFLIIRSRRTIELIHKKRLNSAREILKGINERR